MGRHPRPSRGRRLYTSLGNYGDEELAAIVGALPDETGGTIPERLRWVGINCVPFLVEPSHFFDEITLEDFLPRSTT